jgi:hypothetical protein
MNDLKMTNAGDYMADEDDGKWPGYPKQDARIHITKPVGAWDLGKLMFAVSRRPTDEQIKNTEEMFGWKWMDYES